MNLSRHFTLAEMTFSRTAVAAGIDNTPTDPERANLEALCTSVLDPLRDAAGAAIKVTSAYRGPTLNARVGGERKSQHLEGKAADIQPTTMSVLDLFKTVVRLALPFDQVIYENKSDASKWVHVSHDAASNRGQILIAHFLPTGKVERYEPVTSARVLEMQEAVSRSARRLDELEYDEMADEPGDDDERRPDTSPSPAPVEDRRAVAVPASAKAPRKKVPTKKVVAKKGAGTTATAKKARAKKPTVKKAKPSKTPATKTAAKKVSGKKAAPRKATAKKATAKKVTAKTPAPRKSPARKATKPASRKASRPTAKKRPRRA